MKSLFVLFFRSKNVSLAYTQIVTRNKEPDEAVEKKSKEESGSHNKHLLLITSLVFGGSLIGCIVVGFSLPKPGPRTPHMSAGKTYPDDDPDQEVSGL